MLDRIDSPMGLSQFRHSAASELRRRSLLADQARPVLGANGDGGPSCCVADTDLSVKHSATPELLAEVFSCGELARRDTYLELWCRASCDKFE